MNTDKSAPSDNRNRKPGLLGFLGLDMSRIASFLVNANKYSDIYLALLVVFIIALMILPVNHHVIDFLIAVNLGLSVLLLMTSLYIKRAINLYTFPALLLLSTLFRLSLAIATTRLILLEGYAGDIIQTFGEVVIGGNFVVGAVIFLIITIVQFLVVTKGSERVAEVAARFSLDAMPGKQMSIDADMRSGSISMEEGRAKRDALEKESQLYGSMDGAMKFVKGDAIAGLIIICINLLGGMAIGMFMMDMSAGEAVQLYSTLTIGDGLISQIPALFTSITSGIIVTKVSSEESLHLGGDIGGQLLAEPKALLIGGAVVAAFCLVPGFPKLPFLGFGALLAGTGHAMRLHALKEAAKAASEIKDAPKEPDPPPKRVRALPMPLVVELHADMKGYIDAGYLWDELERLIVRLEAQTGIPFPSFQVYFSGYLEPGSYVLHLNEIPWYKGSLMPGHLLVRESRETLSVLGLTDVHEAPGHSEARPCHWVPEADSESLYRSDTPFLDPYRLILVQAERMMRRNGDAFLGMHETKMILDQLEPMIDNVVKECIRILTVPKISEVLQRLARENISVRNVKGILEALVEWSGKERDLVMLTEQVRVSLGRQIGHWYGAGTNVIPAWVLDPELEDVFRKSIKLSPSGATLVLAPGLADRVVQGVKALREAGAGAYPPPVVLTSMDIRRYLKILLEAEMEGQAVLSYQELPKEAVVHTLARVGVD